MAVISMTVGFWGCGDDDKMALTAAVLNQGSNQENLIAKKGKEQPLPQLIGEVFHPHSSVYSIYGFSSAQSKFFKVYRFGAALSDQDQLEDRIFLTDFRSTRVIAFDLLAGERADWFSQLFGTSFDGYYNLSPGAAKTPYSRWGSGIVKAFDGNCQAISSNRTQDSIGIVSGTVLVRRSMAKLFLKYKLYYRIALDNGEILQGQAVLDKINWPSHFVSFNDIQCLVPQKTSNYQIFKTQQ